MEIVSVVLSLARQSVSVFSRWCIFPDSVWAKDDFSYFAMNVSVASKTWLRVVSVLEQNDGSWFTRCFSFD